MRHYLISITSLFLVFAALSCSSDNDEITIEDTLPKFDAIYGFDKDRNPISISSSDLKGKKGMIVFFSSGCGDCRREMPKAEAVWQTFEGDPSVEIAAISRQGGSENPEAVAEYWYLSGFDMPYYLDTDRVVYEKFAKTIVPRFYLFDSSGVIRHVFVEETSYDSNAIVQMINQMK